MDSITSNSMPNNGGTSGAPPPPPEVKVRTMRSDLESMAKSGGGMPRFENVAVASLAIEKTGDGTNPQKKSQLLTALAVLVALVIVVGGIYFAYRIFFGTPA